MSLLSSASADCIGPDSEISYSANPEATNPEHPDSAKSKSHQGSHEGHQQAI
jgi:hypothetical protein